MIQNESTSKHHQSIESHDIHDHQYVNGMDSCENELKNLLKEDTPILFDLKNRWLKGSEYAHIIRNMDNYCKVFELQRFAPKNHPSSIYVEPQDGMLYFVKGNTIGSDFGFPRLGIKKKYKWKKMNFTTDLPKRDPIVSYIVASAVKCEKFFPGSASEGPAYRMHAVILTKQEKTLNRQGNEMQEHTIDKAVENLTLNDKNKQNKHHNKSSNGKYLSAQNVTQYILCHIRKVTTKYDPSFPEEELASDCEENNKINNKNKSSEDDGVDKIQPQSQIKKFKVSENTLSIQNKIADQLNNQRQQQISEKLNKNISYLSQDDQLMMSDNQKDHRRASHIDVHNSQGLNIDTNHRSNNDNIEKNYSLDLTPASNDYGNYYDDDSEYISNDNHLDQQNKKRLQKRQRKDNSQKSLLQQSAPKQSQTMLQHSPSDRILTRKLSYQPSYDHDSELAQEAQLVKRLMGLNKRYKIVDQQSQENSFQNDHVASQSYSQRLFNQEIKQEKQGTAFQQVTPQSQNHILSLPYQRNYRKFSENFSDNKKLTPLLSINSAFKPIDRSPKINPLTFQLQQGTNVLNQDNILQKSYFQTKLQEHIQNAFIPQIEQQVTPLTFLHNNLNPESINPIQNILMNQCLYNPLVSQQQQAFQFYLQQQLAAQSQNCQYNSNMMLSQSNIYPSIQQQLFSEQVNQAIFQQVTKNNQ